MSELCNHLIEPSWRAELVDEFEKAYFQGLEENIAARRAAGAEIYPAERSIFAAFNLTPFEDVRVVILGQDRVDVWRFVELGGTRRAIAEHVPHS